MNFLKTARKILTVGMIFVLLLHCNYVFLYYSLYKINVKGLTESCCQKKVDDCNAHCYLDKKINEENDNDAKGTVTDLKLKFNEYDISYFSFNPQIANPLSYDFELNRFTASGHLTKTDPPPRS